MPTPADVTYGTNHEFGFDYLRDNMATDKTYQVQRERHFAIVDEVDNILIDEARTPLIISGAAQEDVTAYYPRSPASCRSSARRRLHGRREAEDHLAERARHREAREGAEHQQHLPPENFRLTRYMEAALKAHIIYHRDRDYVVKDGEMSSSTTSPAA